VGLMAAKAAECSCLCQTAAMIRRALCIQ
jgi:hypothetical protein